LSLQRSLEETKIHVLDETGGGVWRGKYASHPDELETTICKHAPGAVRIGLETGPLTTWLWTELSKRRLPMICLDARQPNARTICGPTRPMPTTPMGWRISFALAGTRRCASRAATPCSRRRSRPPVDSFSIFRPTFPIRSAD